MNKFNLYLERFWFIIIFVVAAFCIYEFIVDGVQIGKWYLLALLVPIAMWLVRRGVRIRMEKFEQEKQTQTKSKKK